MQVKKNFTLSQTLQDKNIEENVTQPDKTSLKKIIIKTYCNKTVVQTNNQISE